MHEVCKWGGPRITRAQAEERAHRVGTIIVYASFKTNEFFFTDSHLFTHWRHAEEYGFVPATTVFPLDVVPRPGFEDGRIDTIEKFVRLFEHDRVEIDPAEKYGWGKENVEDGQSN